MFASPPEFAAVSGSLSSLRAPSPLQAASWLSGKLWRFIAPHLSRQKRALANLELAYPEKSPPERRAIAAAMWENLGRTFAESLHIKALTKSDRIVFELAEGFDEAARGAKPFIVCGLHLGNWEILPHGGQRLGVSLIGVYQRMSNPHVEALMRSLRQASLVLQGGPDAQDSHGGARLLARHQGRRLPVLLADLRDDNGPSVPFFGRPARSTVFPALLARMTGVPLYAGAAFRRPGSRFSIRIAPISMPQTNNSAADALCGDANAAAPVRGFHPRGA